MSCENGICAQYKPGEPIVLETFFDWWWYGQSFKSKLAGVDADCDILRASWWMGTHDYSGVVSAAIRATDEFGRPAGGDLSTGSYFQPIVEPDLPPEEKQFNMTAFKLLAGIRYALIVWLDGGDRDHFMYVVNRHVPPTWPGGSYLYSWDYGTMWGGEDSGWDFKFEVYGCVYPPGVYPVAGKGLVTWTP